MTSKDILNAMSDIAPEFITDAAPKKQKNEWRKKFILKWASAAACVTILFSAVGIWLWPESEVQSSDIDAAQSLSIEALQSQKMSGISQSFIVGSSIDLDGGAKEPPPFRFDVSGYVVIAQAMSALPDIYYHFDWINNEKPVAFRLVPLEIIEVINGDGLPKQVLYMMPDYIYCDLTVYDQFVISMSQLATENVVLYNGTDNIAESFPLLFRDYLHHPDLGSFIAFTDGVFDESLWKMDTWAYGYQFGKNYLDHDSEELVVRRGGTLEETLARINAQLVELRNIGFQEPSLRTFQFTDSEALAALDYVSSLKNGVFVQQTDYKTVTFIRYINGCQTDERISINTETQEVTKSGARYDPDFFDYIPDIAAEVQKLSHNYTNDIPKPPHMKPTDQELQALYVYGWYVQVEGTVYGVIRTSWKYTKFIDNETDHWTELYYDESFRIYSSSGTANAVGRDELISIIGDSRHIYYGKYGVGEPLPFN